MVIAASAYVLWGLSPIYWRLVDDVAAIDIVLFRIVACFLLLSVVHLIGSTWGRARSVAAEPRARIAFVATAALLSSNWLVFIWAVNNERVLEVSLGYFINPLLSVVLGVVVLREKLAPATVAAVAIASLGVVVLAIDVGTVPWVSLVLAGTFALYGLIRKTSPAGSLDGLTMEVMVMLPIAVAFVVWRALEGDGVVSSSMPVRNLWLLGTGAVTAAPLLLFASAARQIPLWLIGMLQFIAPTIQFLLGVLAWDEEWSGGQAVGYVIIWFALVIFASDSLRKARRAPAARPALS